MYPRVVINDEGLGSMNAAQLKKLFEDIALYVPSGFSLQPLGCGFAIDGVLLVIVGLNEPWLGAKSGTPGTILKRKAPSVPGGEVTKVLRTGGVQLWKRGTQLKAHPPRIFRP